MIFETGVHGNWTVALWSCVLYEQSTRVAKAASDVLSVYCCDDDDDDDEFGISPSRRCTDTLFCIWI